MKVSIEPGDVYVIAHGSADDIIAEADMTFTYLSNVDDSFALVYGFPGYSEGNGDCCINPAQIDPDAFCSFCMIQLKVVMALLTVMAVC